MEKAKNIHRIFLAKFRNELKQLGFIIKICSFWCIKSIDMYILDNFTLTVAIFQCRFNMGTICFPSMLFGTQQRKWKIVKFVKITHKGR